MFASSMVEDADNMSALIHANRGTKCHHMLTKLASISIPFRGKYVINSMNIDV
jgi:hypothetical protein